jgi:hypothetical protein
LDPATPVRVQAEVRRPRLSGGASKSPSRGQSLHLTLAPRNGSCFFSVLRITKCSGSRTFKHFVANKRMIRSELLTRTPTYTSASRRSNRRQLVVMSASGDVVLRVKRSRFGRSVTLLQRTRMLQPVCNQHSSAASVGLSEDARESAAAPSSLRPVRATAHCTGITSRVSATSERTHSDGPPCTQRLFRAVAEEPVSTSVPGRSCRVAMVRTPALPETQHLS